MFLRPNHRSKDGKEHTSPARETIPRSVLRLDAELALTRARGVDHRTHPRQNLYGEMLHQLCVLVDQRLALGAVGDHEFHLRLRFYVGGEPGPTGADDTVLTQFLTEHKLQDNRGGG
jgi:hypothetical protein